MSSGLPKLDMAAVDDDKAAKNRAKKEKKKQKRLSQKEKPTIKERGRTFVRQASASLKRGLTPRGSRSIDTQEYAGSESVGAGSESGIDGDQSLTGALGPRYSMGPSEADTPKSGSTTAPDTPPPAQPSQQPAGADSQWGPRRSLSISSTSSSASSYGGQEPEIEEPTLEAALAKEVEAEVAREEGDACSRVGGTDDKSSAAEGSPKSSPSPQIKKISIDKSHEPEANRTSTSTAANTNITNTTNTKTNYAAETKTDTNTGANTNAGGKSSLADDVARDSPAARQPDARTPSESPLLGDSGGGGKRDSQGSGDSTAKPALAASVEYSSSLDAAIPAGGALQGGALQGRRTAGGHSAAKPALAVSVEDSSSLDAAAGKALQGGPLQGGQVPPQDAAPKSGLAESVGDSDSDSGSSSTLSTELSEGGTPEQAAARAKALSAKEPVKWKKAIAAIAIFAVGAAASERLVKACKGSDRKEVKEVPLPTPSERSWGFR